MKRIAISIFLLGAAGKLLAQEADIQGALHILHQRGLHYVSRAPAGYGADFMFNFDPQVLANSLPPLAQAIEDENLDTVNQLLHDRRSLRQECEPTYLYRAVKKGNIAIISALLAAGAEVNRANITGTTCMHLLAQARTPQYLAIIDLLLQRRGIDLAKKDNGGQSPLDLARRIGNPQVIARFTTYAARPVYPVTEAYKKNHANSRARNVGSTVDGAQVTPSFAWASFLGYFIGGMAAGIGIYKLYSLVTQPESQNQNNN